MRSRKEKPWMNLAVLLLALALILLANLAGSGATVSARLDRRAAISTNWHTFLGSEPASPGDSDDDACYDVALDSADYAYAVGQSINGDWGSTPIVTHSIGLDGFLAKLDISGTLVWHTFIGGSETDSAQAITVDDADSLFVVGTSTGGDWGSEPITDSHGYEDLFVAKFDPDGAQQWFTFVGTSDPDYGSAIAVDDAGGIYVGGTWVVNPYLAKLDAAGEFQWQTVITSTEGDLGSISGVAVDQSGDLYVAGYAAYGEWFGAPPPVRPHAGSPGYNDAFVAKFDGDDGSLLWHTFLGAVDWDDEGNALVVQTAEATPTVYVGGWSGDEWGTPIHPFSGSSDAFVAQLIGDDGTLVWNTFMGNETYGDAVHAITFGGEGRLLVAGASRDGWGRPVIAHPGGGVGDAGFVAALSADGYSMGNTFVGGASSSDTAYGIAASDQGDVYVAGTSWSPDSVGWSNPHWGTPIRGFLGTDDGFVAGLGERSIVRYWVFAPLIVKR